MAEGEGRALATTALSDFWPSSRHLLFFGKWCFLPSNRAAREGRVYDVLDYPWNDLDRTDRDHAYCLEVYEKVLPRLVEVFNAMHHRSCSPDYWRLVLGYWLFNYIATLYERYIVARTALDRHPEAFTIGLSPEDYQTPRSVLHFAGLVVGDTFNLQLYTQILSWMEARMSLRRLSTQPAGARSSGSFLEQALASLSRQVARRARIVHLNSIFTAREMAALWVHSGLRIAPIIERDHLHWSTHPEVDLERRAKLAEVPSDDEFMTLLVRTLVSNTPSSYVEGYAAAVEETSRSWPRRPRLILTSYLFSFEDFGKIWMAEQKERGNARVIGIQHGGAHGWYTRCFSTQHEQAVADECWSWGWEQSANYAAKGMPSPILNRIRIKRGSDSGRVLVLPVEARRYTRNFMRSPFGPQLDLYLDEFNTFLQAVSPEIREQLFIRVRGWLSPDEAYNNVYAERLAWSRFDDQNRKFADSMRDSRVTVIAYNGTSFLENLAANHPSVFWWDNRMNPMRTEVQEHFDRLRDSAILHHDPVAAAAQLNAIYEDPRDWWLSRRVQDARSSFLEYMGRLESGWMRLWKARVLEAASGKQLESRVEENETRRNTS